MKHLLKFLDIIMVIQLVGTMWAAYWQQKKEGIFTDHRYFESKAKKEEMKK